MNIQNLEARQKKEVNQWKAEIGGPKRPEKLSQGMSSAFMDSQDAQKFKVGMNLLRNVFPIRVENEGAVEHNKYQQSHRISVPQILDFPFEFE